MNITTFKPKFSKDLFLSLLKHFLLQNDFSVNTRKTYKTSILSFLKWLEVNHCTDLDRQQILLWKNYLKNNKSITTAYTYLISLKQFFQYTNQFNLYPNVMDSIKNVRVGIMSRRDYLTPQQILAVLHQTQKDKSLRNYLIILLMVTCGLRVSEVVAINIGDFQFSNGQLILYIQGKGRDGKIDTTIVPNCILPTLQNYLKTRSPLAPQTPLFVSCSPRNSGSRLTAHAISTIIKAIFKRIGLNSWRFSAHSLRHSAITLSLLAGATLQEAQQFARHRLIVTTQIYAHNLDWHNNPCSQKIVETLFPQYQQLTNNDQIIPPIYSIVPD